MSALTLEVKKVSARCSNDHWLDIDSTGVSSAGCSRLETFSPFFFLLVIGPPANPAVLNSASAASAIVVSWRSDHRGILWQVRDLLAPVWLRRMTAGRLMCSRATNDVPHSVYQSAYLVIHLPVHQPVEWPGPLPPQRDFKSDTSYRTANTE